MCFPLSFPRHLASEMDARATKTNEPHLETEDVFVDKEEPCLRMEGHVIQVH